MTMKRRQGKTLSLVRSPLTGSHLKIIANPERESHLAEPLARAANPAVVRGWIRVNDVLVVLVEERPPRPVEVDGEAQRKRLEPDAVGGTAVDQAEAIERDRVTEHGPHAGGGKWIRLVTEQRRERLRV